MTARKALRDFACLSVAVAELCEATSDDAVVVKPHFAVTALKRTRRPFDRFAIGRSLAKLGNCYDEIFSRK